MQTERLTWPTDTVWAVDEARFNNAMHIVRKCWDSQVAMRSPNYEPSLKVEGSTAVIPISGPLTKNPSWWSLFIDSSSYRGISRAVKEALANPKVASILLRIDSPGGSVDGIVEAGQSIFDARGKKPVIAQVDGMAASAAYYLASQADTIYGHEKDSVGSIGTRMMIYDWSDFFEKEGIKAIPIDTGEFKSAGAPGTKITDRQIEYFQGIVNSYFSDFVAKVRRGRRYSAEQMQEVADGRLFIGAHAVALGLIDGIQTLETTLGGMSIGQNSGVRAVRAEEENKPMATATLEKSEATGAAGGATGTTQATAEMRVESKAATLAELKSAFPTSDPAFRESCLEGGMTISQAQSAWSKVLETKLEASEKAVESAKTNAAKPGGEGLGTGKTTSPTSGSARDRWDAAVDANVKRGMTRPNATAQAAKDNPSLHREFLTEYNAQNGRDVSDDNRLKVV